MLFVSCFISLLPIEKAADTQLQDGNKKIVLLLILFYRTAKAEVFCSWIRTKKNPVENVLCERADSILNYIFSLFGCCNSTSFVGLLYSSVGGSSIRCFYLFTLFVATVFLGNSLLLYERIQ